MMDFFTRALIMNSGDYSEETKELIGKLIDDLNFGVEDLRKIKSKYSGINNLNYQTKTDIIEKGKQLKQLFGEDFVKFILGIGSINLDGNNYELNRVISLEDLIKLSNDWIKQGVDNRKQIIEGLLGIREQLTQLENDVRSPVIISSYSFIENTPLNANLTDTEKKEFKENLPQICSNIESTNYFYIESIVGDSIGLNVKKNMAVGMSFMIMEILTHADANTRKKFIEFFGSSNTKKDLPAIKHFFETIKTIINNFSRTKELLEIHDKINQFLSILTETEIKESLGNGNNNKILTNPAKFSKIFINFMKGELNIEEIKKEIINASNEKNYKFTGFTEQEATTLNNIASTYFEKLDKIDINNISRGSQGLTTILDNLGSIKENGKRLAIENSEILIGFKKTAESLGVWESLKKILDFILKILGYKGFDDFENEFLMKKYITDINNFTNLQNISPEKKQFVDKIKTNAESISNEIGIPVNFIIAQAGIATNWGQAELMGNNNLFGYIETNAQSINIIEINGKKFKKYNNINECFEDYKNILKENKKKFEDLKSQNQLTNEKIIEILKKDGYGTKFSIYGS